MPYGVIMRVKAPIQAYDATHAEIMNAAGPEQVSGFILHIARATEDGFEIIEVWESKEQAETFNREVGWPAMQRVGMSADAPQPETIEFDPRTVVTTGSFDFNSA